MFENKDVVSVMGNLYVKTPKALKSLLADLGRRGYEVKDLRKESYRLDRGTTVEQMEKNGWSLWFASMPDLRFGKCNSCKSLISTVGIRVHGHKCESCGEVTYYDMVDGSTLTFVFNTSDRGFMSPQLRMKVKLWDVANSVLYLYPEFLEGGLSVVTGQRAETYLKQNSQLWRYASIGEEKLIAIYYPLEWKSDSAVIEPYDISGHHWNHKIVKVWDGKEYGEFDRLPVPESMSIYESWHWSPLPATPRLHERILSAAGQVSDKGYYYQDGRAAFSSRHWQEMAKFVRHFTVLDGDRFDAAWPRFRNSGPGGIDDLAHFCHGNPIVTNEPNIANTLIALSKASGGQSLTEDETREGLRGLGSDGADVLKSLFKKK